eukprot:GHVP01060435.1.p1 GENE.GHVP01060435.1~~GHVP01060435.1.p1  ORF type:complete len:301 (+),score=74.83 GHVP01060435.1:203-1105(+)
MSAYLPPLKKMGDKIGTAYYIAPEILKERGYSEKCDIWSAGVILYIMLSGTPPFNGQTESQILKKVALGKFQFDNQNWEKTSVACRDLIAKMLTYSPESRITAQEALNHEWFNQATEEVSSVSLSKALGTMKMFQAEQRMAQAALLFISSKLSTDEETKELTIVFKSMDTNNDGQLDRGELIAGLHKVKKEQDLLSLEAEVDEILRNSDLDKNGFISYGEFLTASADQPKLLSNQKLETAFQMFDTNKDGKVSSKELRKIFQNSETDIDEISAMIKKLDTDGDGEIDFVEFKNMLIGNSK